VHHDFGVLWHPLASFGIRWHPLASFGILWHPLASFGILWHPLASFGILWHPFHASFIIIDSGFLATSRSAVVLTPSHLTAPEFFNAVEVVATSPVQAGHHIPRGTLA